MSRRRSSTALACALLALPCLALAQPSTNLDTYALFAAKQVTAKGITLMAGNIGVNDGFLFVHDYLVAPTSDVAADQVNVPGAASCAQQFANTSARTSANCGLVGGTPTPIVPDVAAACGFPSPFPLCDAAQAVTVAPGASLSLAAGTYGDLRVARGGSITLTGGSYQFCSIKVSRAAHLDVQAPVEVDVAGKIAIGSAASAGPAAGSGLAPGDVRLFSAGTSVHFSRQSQVQGRLCAPDASLRLTQGGSHAGTFIALAIGTEHIEVDHDPGQQQGCQDIGDGFCGGDCPPRFECRPTDGGCHCALIPQ